jgi:UDP-N-acetylmuramoyl-tripeptide--D-alanyl-D-alanine ligase
MFISVPKTIECVLISLVMALGMMLSAQKYLGILQQCGYKNEKFGHWSRRKSNLTKHRFFLLGLCCLLSYAVLALCFSFTGQWAAVIGMAGFVIFFALFIVADHHSALKCPLKFTPRFKRLEVVLFVVCAIVTYLFVSLLNFADAVWGNFLFSILKYAPLSLLPIFLFVFVCFANWIALLYEIPRNKKYIKSALKKLQKTPIPIVGITGSYGKTSVKNILAALLSSKYRVLATPRSHNTPLGISLAVNNNNLEEYDVFIAEMGARNVGDIDELCQLFPPKYAVITGICAQHYETFGSFENIVKAKAEILKYPQKAFIAADCYEYFQDNPCEKEVCNSVSNIVANAEGTTFTLTLGKFAQRVTTKLLGEHSAHNIGLAAQVAFAMGVPFDDIIKSIEQLTFVEHRLQLLQENGINILDDGYNANVKGAEAALGVLSSFQGRKFVVTPGLVELGVLEEKENEALGAKLTAFDGIILVGKTLVKPVMEGYLRAGGNNEKICIVPNLPAAQDKLKTLLHTGDTVLFLNDLPDYY